MTVVTEAFRTAGMLRAKVLGMPEHPRVIIEHPIANKSDAEVTSMAERFVAEIVSGLVTKT